MKKEYYIRNKKIQVEELTDVLSIKPQGVEKEMNIEEKLGARTKLSGDSRNASRLSEQQERFEKAGYIFIKPNEKTRSKL